ncbi:MAG: hypothetical protein ACYTEL_26355 [Planctomycetota bacterium]|jgi:hypothetical protein
MQKIIPPTIRIVCIEPGSEKPPEQKKPKLRWVIIPAALLVVLIVAMNLAEAGCALHNLLIPLALLDIVWLATVVHLRYRNKVATGLVCSGVLLTLLVAAGDVALGEAIKVVQNLINNWSSG